MAEVDCPLRTLSARSGCEQQIKLTGKAQSHGVDLEIPCCQPEVIHTIVEGIPRYGNVLSVRVRL